MRRIVADGDLLDIRRLREGWRDGYLSDHGDHGAEPIASGDILIWNDEDADPASIGG